MKIEIGISTYRLSDVARSCGGCLLGADRPLRGICTDSREAEAGWLFVALRGERTDGHAYIRQAMARGCQAVLCEEFSGFSEDLDVSAVVVPNTERALADMATDYIRNRSLLRIAVTGSAGKTTTKEFLHAVFSQRFNTYKTEANYNSLIGMPISVMGLRDTHEAAIFEMGMSAQGEIACLSSVVQPDIAVITNIGSSHLEYLGTRENIARAKLEIVTGLRDNGCLVVNGDEPLLQDLQHEKYRIFGLCVHGKGDYSVSNIHQDPGDWRTEFDLQTPSGEVLSQLCIAAIGTHMVYDAAYAAAIGLEWGLTEEEIRAGFAQYQSEKLRQALIPMGDITLLADCYNAAPESMSVALHVLNSYAKARGGRAIAVLGDMRELGDQTHRLHEMVGAEVASLDLSTLVTLGELAVGIAEGAAAHGMKEDKVFMFRDSSDLSEAAKVLNHVLRPNDVVLIKASRAIAAERMIGALQAIRGAN